MTQENGNHLDFPMPLRHGFIAFSCLEEAIFSLFSKKHIIFTLFTQDREPLLAESTANCHTTAKTVENGGRRRVITYINTYDINKRRFIKQNC